MGFLVFILLRTPGRRVIVSGIIGAFFASIAAAVTASGPGRVPNGSVGLFVWIVSGIAVFVYLSKYVKEKYHWHEDLR